jgi:small GTP-binding protein
MPNRTARADIPPGFNLRDVLRGHEAVIESIGWTPKGRRLASAADDMTVRIWNLETGRWPGTLVHPSEVTCVAWSPDAQSLASGADDAIIRIWDMKTGGLSRTLEGHFDSVVSVTWSPDGRRLASGSWDRTIRIWDVDTGELLETIRESHSVNCVAWSPTEKVLASGDDDGDITLWSPTEKVLASGDDDGNITLVYAARPSTLSGHSDAVTCVVWSPDGQRLASASIDSTVRIWDFATRQQRSVLEGHTGPVTGVSFSTDGRLLASKSSDGSVRLWNTDSWETIAILKEPAHPGNYPGGVAFHPKAPVLATRGEADTVIHVWDLDLVTLLETVPASPSIHYVNAKVVLVGESGVGKSGLGIRIAGEEFRATESTHGAQFWQIPVGQIGKLPGNVEAELTLWDLAGQAEYRLVHQLFLDDTDAALLLFDCSDPADPFRGVPYWAKVLRKQAPAHAVKFLVSARTDVCPITVDRHQINYVLTEYGLHSYLRTSAKTGAGVAELKEQILESIPWNKLPRTTTPLLFQTIRDFLLECKKVSECKKGGRTLLSMAELRSEVRRRYTEGEVTQAEIDTVVGLLQAQGLVHRLEPGPRRTLVLLRPELLNQYASSVIHAARNNPRGIGAIPERDVLIADLPLTGFNRLEAGEERIVLESMVELLIRHDLCFREMGLLVFPSQINVTRPAPTEEHPPTEVTYQFSGGVEAIYASLVVRLSYTDYFRREDQWKYAVEFSREDNRLGFAMRQLEEGTGELEIYFYPGVSEFDHVTFTRFITDHLRTKGIDIQERFRIHCSQCGKEVTDQAAIELQVQMGRLDIPCQYCRSAVIIPRSIEERFRSDRSYVEKQQQLVKAVEKRTEREVIAFKRDKRQYTKQKDHRLHILHISDIHIGNWTFANLGIMYLNNR